MSSSVRSRRCARPAEPSGIAPLAQILALRQKEAAPIMAAFKKWVDDLLPGVPPKTALGKALAYTTRQWEKLSRFLSDPEMPADNNYCENQIRPFAVGRRSWLFVDSQLGAKASANLYSIVMTCRANGIEPYAYLCHLFEEFPKAKTAEQLEALLPWNAKATVASAAAHTDAELAA
jgi:transposase